MLNQPLFPATKEGLLRHAEYLYLEEVITKFPKDIFAYVADSYDYFGFLTKILPLAKDSIMAREGKMVVRGDSGDPVEIICGSDIKDYSDATDLDKAAYTAFSENFYVKSHKNPIKKQESDLREVYPVLIEGLTLLGRVKEAEEVKKSYLNFQIVDDK